VHFSQSLCQTGNRGFGADFSSFLQRNQSQLSRIFNIAQLLSVITGSWHSDCASFCRLFKNSSSRVSCLGCDDGLLKTDPGSSMAGLFSGFEYPPTSSSAAKNAERLKRSQLSAGTAVAPG
jgi:hypothetical protein